jgi:hypothetical protein
MEHRWGKRFLLNAAVKLRLRTGAALQERSRTPVSAAHSCIPPVVCRSTLTCSWSSTATVRSRAGRNAFPPTWRAQRRMEWVSSGASSRRPRSSLVFLVDDAIARRSVRQRLVLRTRSRTARRPARFLRRSATVRLAHASYSTRQRLLLLRHLDDGARYRLDPHQPVMNAFHARRILGDDPQADTLAVVGNDSP